MSSSHTKATERIDGTLNDGNPATWLSMASAGQYLVMARAGTASPTDDVTIQLRKATDASGTNATNLGSAVTAAGFAAASARAEELGEFSAGVPFTHVSATITDEASPNTYDAVAVLTDLHYAP